MVLRGVFVPDGQKPPPEFSSDLSPLRVRATLDPTTGAITCDDAGISFDGDIRGDWYPDEEQEADDE